MNAIDIGSMVTVRHKTTGKPQASGIVVGFDHEHQFVCVECFVRPSEAPRFLDLDADRLTMGWQRIDGATQVED